MKKSNMINVSAEFVIEALQARFDEVENLWGCPASWSLWDKALDMVAECGLAENVTSPSIFVDNYLINGDFTSKKDESGFWIAETSLDGKITTLIDQMNNETDLNEIYNLQDLIKDLITDAWNEYCRDNALIYNDDFACLSF